MKVTVSKYLNVRVGHPSPTAPCYQYLAPGSEIEVDGQLYVGDYYDGINTWMKDDGGNYYWSGGVAVNLPKKNVVFSHPQSYWNIDLFGIKDIWEKTKGKGIRVAVLDTGIDLYNPALKATIAEQYNVLDNTTNVQDLDKYYIHGTTCCSIIASRMSNMFCGIAPESELIVIKIANDESDLTDANKILGLKKALEFMPDIISLSFGSSSQNGNITGIVKDIISSGIICIAAAGNNRNIVDYPANIKGMISVGNIGYKPSHSGSIYDQFILSNMTAGGISNADREGVTIVAPGDGISAFDLQGNIYQPYPGTSWSAPYVAGVAALWLSVTKAKNIPQNYHNEFRDFLIKNAVKNNSHNSLYWGNGIIQPQFISKI